MNITFNSSHMKTLKKLQDIAEKHDAIIRMGMDSISSSDDEPSILLDFIDFSDKTKDFIEVSDYEFIEKIDLNTFDSIWFSLIYNEGSHSLNYQSSSLSVKLENADDFINSISDEEIQEEMENKLGSFAIEKNWLSISDSVTVIYGFGNKEIVKDHRVYRSGMALKFFSDLVCDYLGEPRIIETY